MENRRKFLKSAFAAGAFVNLNPDAIGANDRVTLALIGGRNQGNGDALRAVRAGARIKTLCDLDPKVLEKTGGDIAKLQGAKPEFEGDFRRVLDDKEIDAVLIATPDHWHARMSILACQAGKDVYVEKPLCQTIHEGQLIRDAARKHNRVVQLGTQFRSMEHYKAAAEFVASGRLGKVPLIKCWHNQIRVDIGKPADSNPPIGVDYDRWLGPAPKRPFNENRFHYTWRYFWDYGNSEIGNQGIHILDLALWAIQLMRGFEGAKCLPKRISSTGGIYWLNDAKEIPDTQSVNYDYGDMMLNFELHSFATDYLAPHSEPRIGPKTAGGPGDYATAYYGIEGTVIAFNDRWEVHWRDGKVETTKASGGSHEANFLDAVKTRKKPNADVEIGRLSTMLCHLGNVSYKLGRDVRFDPKSEKFGDAEANKLLSKEYRAGYELPKV
jgi:predicted dehydrogenase